MPPVNTRTAAVVDPILSTHARGYRNAEMVAQVLFPRVTVTNRAMRVIKFGKESFRMLNGRRAPGANTRRVQYGYTSEPIALRQDALEGVVPMEHQEEAQSVPGIDLGRGAINMVLDSVDLALEYESAQMARSTATYDANHRMALAGSARWRSSTSDPGADILAGKEAVRRSIGRYPNTLVLGPSAANAAKNHPKIKEQFKYVSKDSITAEMLAAYFELKRVVIGAAVYLPEAALDTDPAIDVWGDDAVLAYVPEAGDTYQVPSYGYTYELAGYPLVEQPYYERPVKSWIYPTTVERRPYVVGAEGGFLIKDAGGAV